MSESRNKRISSKVSTVPRDYATPPRARQTQAMTFGSPLPRTARAQSLAINRGRGGIHTPEQESTTRETVYRSVSASMSTPRKRSQVDRKLTNSDEKKNLQREPLTKKQARKADQLYGDSEQPDKWMLDSGMNFGIHVGHHINWHDVQIEANINSRGDLIIRAPKSLTPEEVVAQAWPNEFPCDTHQDAPNVAYRDVKIKNAIAKYYKGDLNKATYETKRNLLLEYLTATHEGRAVNHITEESYGTRPIRDYRVGTHRRHGLSVYAFLSNGVIHFRIHEEDNKKLVLPKKAVDFDDVKFLPEYGQGTPKETKEYIFKRLINHAESPELGGTFSREHQPSCSPRLQDEYDDLHSNYTLSSQAILGQEEDDGLFDALQNFEQTGKLLKNEVLKREGALQEHHIDLTREKERLVLLEQSLMQRQNVLEVQEKLGLDRKEVLAEKKRLNALGKTLEENDRVRKRELDEKAAALVKEENRLQSLKTSMDKRDEQLVNDRAKQDKQVEKSRESLLERKNQLDKRDAAIEQKESAQAEKEKALELRERAIKNQEQELSKKEESNRRRAEQVDKQEAALKKKALMVSNKESTNGAIARLKADYTAKIKQKDAEIAVYKDPYRLRIDSETTFSRSFHKIPDDQPNGGMYLEKAHASVAGKGDFTHMKFDHFRIVQFPAIKVEGELVKEGYEYDGHKYSVYRNEGKIKLVQDFEPGMLRQQDNRLVISWNCLKEQGEPSFTI
ncbi:uncharacterized protein LY89DRAFT_170555 [Mollisia scopiformis]|uniref:Uncharacterized protein n=1 Tax=Mollisia scopiformis TaxID=149040 RepID=A0A194XSS2_MOLSC|nr:uncharacterized protein LY89DRAFT_170555 [Mollisia scopiformis]KUJ23191.1 hypothetical protein LY89DRAFT_170555 [Mollisia scopiformis]